MGITAGSRELPGRNACDRRHTYCIIIIIIIIKVCIAVTDCHTILARWRNPFSQLLNIHGFNDVRQAEIHTAKPLAPEPSALSLRWLLKS